MNKAALFLLLFSLAACGPQGGSTSKNVDETYDRVIASSTLRCGYSVWPPLFQMDPNTGEKGGIFGDVVNEIAKRNALKIEWVEELGWGVVTEALKSKRVDAACAGYWSNTNRGKYLFFTKPLFFSPAYVWVRGDDTRPFPPSAEGLNNQNYTAGYVDGSAEGKAIQNRFPGSKTYTLPEIMPSSDLFEALKSGKVDFIVMDAASISDYLAKNPGALRKLYTDTPVTVFPNVMLLPGGENRLKSLFDAAIDEIRYDGTLERILDKYNARDLYIPVKD